MNESGPAQRELPGPGTGNEAPMRAKRNDGFDYTVYLASPEWAVRREDALARAEKRCQLCYSSKALQVHHRTYARIGNEDSGDLTVLCGRCHAKHHSALPNGPTKQRGDARATSRQRPSISRGEKQELGEQALVVLASCGRRGFTARELAEMLDTTPQRAGTALGYLLRHGKVVKGQGRRWYSAAALDVESIVGKRNVA